MNLLRSLFFSAWLCVKASKAFVFLARAPAVRPFLSRSGSVRTRAIHDAAPPTTATTTTVGRRRRRKREGGAQSALSMAMKGRPAPQLTEEELASMGNSREKANRQVEEFLKNKRAEKEARRKEEQAEQRSKIVSRIKAEQEDVEHKKVYIPQRLEEIEKEQAQLDDRMSAFNAKIKDNKEIKKL